MERGRVMNPALVLDGGRGCRFRPQRKEERWGRKSEWASHKACSPEGGRGEPGVRARVLELLK